MRKEDLVEDHEYLVRGNVAYFNYRDEKTGKASFYYFDQYDCQSTFEVDYDEIQLINQG